MIDLFWLMPKQMQRIKRYVPLSHGVPRVDDRRVISGILHVIRNGLRWRDAPAEYGPYKTIYNRFVRWSGWAFSTASSPPWLARRTPDTLRIDATHLKAHRTAASLLKRGSFPMSRAHQGRPELQAAHRLRRTRATLAAAAQRRPSQRFQGRDADDLRSSQSQGDTRWPGYDADWFRSALKTRGIMPCILSKPNRMAPIPHDKALYRQRHCIENMFGRLKDRRRSHARCTAAPTPSWPSASSPPPSSSGCQGMRPDPICTRTDFE